VTDPVLAMLLADIIRHPGDDGPRLAYADRLEETGADNVRAEFIRTQLEVEPLRLHGHGTHHPHGGACPTCSRVARLEAREAILWGANYARWADALPGPWTAHGVNTTGGCQVFMSSADNSTVARLCFERGFPARIRLVSGDWLGGGVGWPGWGPALVRAAPLTLVSVSDRQPSPHPLTSMPRLWSWYGGVGGVPDAHRLRWDLFKRLPGWLDQERMDYASRADAETALSLACLAWARAVAPPAPAPVD
jgi:uncharacterized protein (TIGR02996 family)